MNKTKLLAISALLAATAGGAQAAQVKWSFDDWGLTGLFGGSNSSAMASGSFVYDTDSRETSDVALNIDGIDMVAKGGQVGKANLFSFSFMTPEAYDPSRSGMFGFVLGKDGLSDTGGEATALTSMLIQTALPKLAFGSQATLTGSLIGATEDGDNAEDGDVIVDLDDEDTPVGAPGDAAVSPVPVPASLPLLFAGFAGLAFLRRRSSSAA